MQSGGVRRCKGVSCVPSSFPLLRISTKILSFRSAGKPRGCGILSPCLDCVRVGGSGNGGVNGGLDKGV